MTRAALKAIILATCTGAASSTALADPMKIEAVLAPKEQIRLDFADGSKHFLLLSKREGRAAGNGPLVGAMVTEYGRHDIVPGVAGDAGGYLVFAASSGDIAYIKWLVRAVFVSGPGGKPVLLDNGVWEIVGGIGKFKGSKGAGILHIKATSPTDRNFILEGEIVSGPE